MVQNVPCLLNWLITHFFPQYHVDTSNRIESESIPGTAINLFCENKMIFDAPTMKTQKSFQILLLFLKLY